ncbi:MAG: 4'-phosphopantetheinyl transferase family protein [Flavobacteriales bacterium]
MKSIVKQIKSPQFSVVIASIEQDLIYDDQIPFHITNFKKKIEWINTRLLLRNFFPKNELHYNKYGAPEINSKAISISHTNNYTSFIVAKKKAAIDIEKISDRTLGLVTKFLNLKEQEKFNTPIETTICWSAKECLYKLHQKGNLNFIKDLEVKFIEQNFVLCRLYKQEIKLHLQKFADHVLVYYYE